MTNEQILKKAIEKAVKNGFKWYGVHEDNIIGHFQNINNKLCREMYFEIIFSHNFAKALWGEDRDIIHYKEIIEGEYSSDISIKEFNEMPKSERSLSWKYYTPVYKNRSWRFHLTEMVLEKDPIKYLEKFVV